MTDIGFHVDIDQCFGCNRLRIPKPWTPATLELLHREGRLRVREYLCGRDDCGVWSILGSTRAKPPKRTKPVVEG